MGNTYFLSPRRLSHNFFVVIPTKAGNQDFAGFLGPRLRGDDDRNTLL